MLGRALPLLLLALSPPAGGTAAADDLDRALAGLGSASAEERRLATRWLGIHASPDQFPRLARAAETGDAEVRARLARALGSDDRHLGLAALFLGEEALAGVGEEAVAELLLRWNPRLDEPPLEGALLAERFAAWNDELAVQALRLPGEESVERAVDLLRRLGPLPLPVAIDSVLDGGVAIGEPRQREGLGLEAGTWDELLVEIGERSGFRLEGLGLGEERPAGLLCFTLAWREPRTALAAPVRWCRELAGDADETRRARAARALGASGWPAAIGWLEARWVARGDPAALEGLLVAAGSGRVAPSLARAEAAEELLVLGLDALAAAAAHASEGDAAAEARALRRAERIGGALGGIGPIGAEGEDLAALVLRGWDDDPPAVLAWRLAVLEEQGGGSPEARSVLARVLAAEPGRYAPPVLLQALRAWERTAGELPLPALGDPAGLLAAPQEWEHVRELAGLLVRAGLEPPGAWLDPDALPEHFELRPRLVLLEWLLGLDRRAAAADHLAGLWLFTGVWPALPPQPQALDEEEADLAAWRDAVARHFRHERTAEILRDWIAMGHADRVREVLERARRRAAGGSPLMLDRLAALAGAIDPLGDQAPALARYLLETGGTDVAALGALAGLPEGGELRSHLRRLLAAALESSVGSEWSAAFVAAVERALGDLRAVGEEAAARQLENQVRSVARAHPTHPLAHPFLDSHWPPAPRSRPVELAARARPPLQTP